MSKIPKLKPLPIPEGYFDALPEKIVLQTRVPKQPAYLGWAAAAVVLLGVGLWQAGGWEVAQTPSPALFALSAEEEILLYIDSEQWSAEDVLSLHDDPNTLLDEIIEEELAKSDPLWTEEETWF